MTWPLDVRRLTPNLESAFLALHDDANGAGWCRCVAWWVPTWEGWGDRTAAENLALRRALWSRGEHDGFLAFADERLVGWVQVGPRDRLRKLVTQLERPPDDAAWAVSCVLVAPDLRGHGVAAALLDGALEALQRDCVVRIEAYPRSGPTESDDAWTGPERLYAQAGFQLVRRGEQRSVVRLEL